MTKAMKSKNKVVDLIEEKISDWIEANSASMNYSSARTLTSVAIRDLREIQNELIKDIARKEDADAKELIVRKPECGHKACLKDYRSNLALVKGGRVRRKLIEERK